ncbi:hypothetical protein [Methanospirillum sp.]|uniref:hypothetical protein n=1 Tax=Methanospirillum sp. TaxID=45200 RepID=UPI0035A19869
MKKLRIIQVAIVIGCFILMTVWCVAAFSMSSGISSSTSSGGFSSSGSTSSNLGFSSTSLVMTGGTPSKPAAAAPSIPAGGPGIIPASEIIPPHWNAGTRSGTFFDPVTQTSWFFDNVLQKFYTPTYGWFLVTQFTKEGKIYAQFYYDPKSGVFRDMKTGATFMGPADSVQSSGALGQSETQTGPFPSPTPTYSSPSDTPPIIAAGGSSVGTPASAEHPCRIICDSCPSGYCDDCNQNGVCDETESYETPVITGTKPYTGTTEESTRPQESGPATSPVIPSSVSADGGLSETPQSTIYYYEELPQSGVRPIVACDPYQDCKYCLDIDDDGACTILDLAIIRCNGKWGLNYMESRDNNCDSDILLIMDCSDPSECTFAEFCRDEDGDGLCDEETITGLLL